MTGLKQMELLANRTGKTLADASVSTLQILMMLITVYGVQQMRKVQIMIMTIKLTLFSRFWADLRMIRDCICEAF